MDIKTFDRAAVLAALEPPRFRDGATEYVGVILSAPDWFRLEEQLFAAGDANGISIYALIQAATNQIFPPPPPRPWWARWRRRAPTVAELIATMPFAAQVEVFQGFVAAQARAHRGTNPGLMIPPPTPPSTN